MTVPIITIGQFEEVIIFVYGPHPHPYHATSIDDNYANPYQAALILPDASQPSPHHATWIDDERPDPYQAVILA